MIESGNIVKAVHWIGKFRTRIILMFIFPFLFSCGVYFISDVILKIITQPLNNQPLYFMTPIEGIMAKLKVAFFGGIVLSFPIIAYFLISIFGTLLEKKKRLRLYFIVIPFSSIAMAGGIYFGFRFILPTTMDFLLSCGDGFMSPMISGSNYVSFISFFMISVGLVFELPLILVALSRIGIIKAKMLMKKRKMAIIIIVIILAIVTPTPDAFTLLAVSFPVVFLYELSIWWIFILEKFDKKKASE